MNIQQTIRWQEEAQKTKEGFRAFLKAEIGVHNTPVEDAVKRTLPGWDTPVLFCPDCANHEVKSQTDEHPSCTHGDCKNLIGELRVDPADGRWKFYTITQCACCGPAHGTLDYWGLRYTKEEWASKAKQSRVVT